MGRTHVLLGLNTLWLPFSLGVGASPQLGASPQTWPVLVVATGFGALLPDLDASASLLQGLSVGGLRPMVLPAQMLHRQFGHRGALHSLWGLGIFAVLTVPLVIFASGAGGLLIWTGLLLGYASHLVGDGCTRSGIPLFYPRLTRIHLLPRGLRLSTGSSAEDAVFALLAMGALALLLRLLASPYALQIGFR